MTSWLDVNHDGLFTITDVELLAKYIGCWPGNFLLNVLRHTPLGTFFEIGPFDQYTTAAWTISVIVWLVVWAFVWGALDRPQ